ncbi:MAG: hypothetical protein EKK63_12735 [Acinetobacter sp.]|uniref:AAA family ATPase n=1 Tax=Acinetobacter sp. TaxID=472 RepID=UPI000FA90D55|nr:AAA family ATPase [Acinetobacter sp.]RUP38240.1 MAG: hypothetical protein EKK63_12735 [Acinetobacter sp.]
MRIELRRLTLLNFKGVRNLTIDFDKYITRISGDNGTGKSTIFDAFTWLLFDKNSSDEKSFNIKTLDANNNPIHRLEHEVTGEILVDEVRYELKKLFKEKWTKPKGQLEPVFSGHETEYFFNGVPLTQRNYNAKVDSLLSEGIAKLITNPLYFNTIKWQDRRGVLAKMAGVISDIEIAGENHEFLNLIQLLKNKTIDELKKEIASKKSKIKEELDYIPAKIEEADRNKPQAEDYTALQKEIDTKNEAISKIETEIDNGAIAYRTKLDDYNLKQREKNELENKLNQQRFKDSQVNGQKKMETRTLLQNAKMELSNLENTLVRHQRSISDAEAFIMSEQNRLTAKQNEWDSENSKEFVANSDGLSCPTCKRDYDEAKKDNIVSEWRVNFNNNKNKNLDAIEASAKGIKANIADKKDWLEKVKREVDNISVQINTQKTTIETLVTKQKELDALPAFVSEEAVALDKQISEFVMPDTIPAIDNTELKAKRASIVAEIDQLKARLLTKDQITRLDTRITELKEREKELSQQIAENEKLEFTIEQFNKAKIDTIEQRINSKFKIVKFRMFNQQVNGGYEECCDCMKNGVPFSDVNTAGRIEMGIDIINALCEHYDVYAPIFIDNRESIVNIPACNSQIVNLYVVAGQPLTIN